MGDRLPVVVAGAGPGGSATAVALRRRGVNVVVMDRARFPRDKVCGDVVLPEAQRAVAALGLDARDLESRGYACTGSRYVATDGSEVAGVFRDREGQARRWWMIKRLVLDEWLMKAARASGAEVREGWEVQDVLRGSGGRAVGVSVKRPDGRVENVAASAVIGADGATSAVARSLGVFNQFPDHLCLAARSYVRGARLPEPYLEIFTTEQSLPGCAWIVPVGEDEWNVGVGIIKADAERMDVTPRAVFEQVRDQVPLFAERLRGLDVPKLRGWSLPGSSEGRPIVGHGSLLVGDAGAMVDPFTGHGIHHALMAGGIAGDVLAAALERGDVTAPALMDHDRRCRADFLGEAQTGYHLQRIHARATLMRLATHACNAHPGLRWAFLALLGHSAPRHDVLAPRSLLGALFSRGPADHRDSGVQPSGVTA